MSGWKNGGSYPPRDTSVLKRCLYCYSKDGWWWCEAGENVMFVDSTACKGGGKGNIELFNFHVKMKFASNCLFPCNNLAFCFHFCLSFLEAL